MILVIFNVFIKRFTLKRFEDLQKKPIGIS